MVTGYLPSVMLMLFLYSVPPVMSTLAAVEGPIARSGRKMSACHKVLLFMIWNVFFSNILSGSVLESFDRISSLKDIPLQLADGVPSMVYTLLINRLIISFFSALLVVYCLWYSLICPKYLLHLQLQLA